MKHNLIILKWYAPKIYQESMRCYHRACKYDDLGLRTGNIRRAQKEVIK